jgi:hypothetical protein
VQYWIGIASFTGAAFLLHLGFRHRRRVLALASREELAREHAAAASDPRSLAAMGEIARPIVLLFLGWIGLKTTAAFYMMGGPRHLSVVDLCGFLALLAGYGTLLTLQTRYRLVDAMVVQRARGNGVSELEREVATSAEPGCGATPAAPVSASPAARASPTGPAPARPGGRAAA